MSTSEEKIAKALDLANSYGGIDGAHHKMWVIDQMVRALTGVPVEKLVGTDVHGHQYEYTAQTTNEEYAAWIRDHCAGDEGPDTYSWDVGIPP
jgi:hypothetical protein